MPYISKFTTLNGTQYTIKDAEAREMIQSLQEYSDYLGVTTTALVDNVTTNPVVSIGGENKTAVKGNIVNYGSKEFVYNGTVWQEFGDMSAVKALAYKDEASGQYTPAGNVTKPDFTGTEATISIKYTPEGSVSVTPTVELNKQSVTPIDSVGTLPSCTMPQLSMTVVNENLTFSWTNGTFSAGTLPTQGTPFDVATSVKTATATGSFTGTEKTVSTKYTPEGSVTQPTFNGTQGTVTVS